MTRVYDEIIDAIAGGLSPTDVASWKPSQRVKNRVGKLIASEKKGEKLSPDELAELNHYLEIEHLMRLAKARARQRGGLDCMKLNLNR